MRLGCCQLVASTALAEALALKQSPEWPTSSILQAPPCAPLRFSTTVPSRMHKTLLLCFIHGFKVRDFDWSLSAALACLHDFADDLENRVAMTRSAGFRSASAPSSAMRCPKSRSNPSYIPNSRRAGILVNAWAGSENGIDPNSPVPSSSPCPFASSSGTPYPQC